MRKVTDLKGFTLIEILIVIGLIAILAAVTIIALNPTGSFEDARNSERNTEMSQIHTAIGRWVATGDGSTSDLRYNVALTALPVCTGTAPNFTNGVPFPSLQIAPTLVAGGYLSQHPTDPEEGATPYYNICYSSAAGPLTLYAPNVDGTRVTLTR